MPVPHPAAEVGQREKLRPRNNARKNLSLCPGAFSLEGLLTSGEVLLFLLAFMTTARQAGPLRVSLTKHLGK